METGQRGFVITGKDEFLEPYENALASFAGLLNEEKTLVRDNPAQVKLLQKIEASVQEWQDKAAAPEIAMRRKIGEASVDAYRLQEILSQGVGKRLMDRFMALGHEIEVSFSEQADWEGAFIVEVIEKCMTDREDGQRGFLITGQEEFLDKYRAGEQQKLPEYFARLRSLVSDRGRTNELSGKIDRLEKLAVEWSHKAAEPEISARRIMNEHPESLKDVAALLEMGTGKRILDRIREDFRKFIEEEERLTNMRFASASRASRRTTNTTILLALVFLIFGGFMAIKITRGITKPVRKLASALGMVSHGDLSQEIEVKSNDEIGVLSTSFNRMVSDLTQLDEERSRADQTLRAAQGRLLDHQRKERTRVESELAKVRDELVNKTRLATIGQVSASIGHELRNPLGAVRNAVYLLKSRASKPGTDSARYLNIIDEETSRASATIDNLMEMTRPKEPSKEEVDLGGLVRESCSRIPDGIGWQVTLDPDPFVMHTSSTQLRQVLRNLIGNSLEALDGRGKIEVDATRTKSHDRIIVRDDGPGIPRESRARLFEPLYSTKAKGTGLGLTICRQIIEQLGGTIGLVDEEESGAAFEILLSRTGANERGAGKEE